MIEIVVIVALVLVLLGVLIEPLISRSRRRRRRADRRARQERIEREWGFVRSVFGPRPKRLTHDGGDGTDD